MHVLLCVIMHQIIGVEGRARMCIVRVSRVSSVVPSCLMLLVLFYRFPLVWSSLVILSIIYR